LWTSLRRVWSMRSLAFAVVGIAFFTFVVAFMRGAVYMLGESRVPRWSELGTSFVVGMSAAGIAVGSLIAGWVSGKKVETGLVLLGGVGMVITTILAAFFLDRVFSLILCIGLIGFFTSFYLVPLFTQLQHEAPKESKGDVIATSNFINVTGA